jgi:hypothetical protein
MKWVITMDRSDHAKTHNRIGWGTVFVSDKAKEELEKMPVAERREFIRGYTSDTDWTHEFALFNSDGVIVYGGRCEDPAKCDDRRAPLHKMVAREMMARPVGSMLWEPVL